MKRETSCELSGSVIPLIALERVNSFRIALGTTISGIGDQPITGFPSY
jgi:hypothetical protein